MPQKTISSDVKTLTMSKAFIDTNVLIYAQDPRSPTKQRKSRELLAMHEHNGSGVISTQVLQEFYVITTMRFALPPLAAKRMVQDLQIFEVVTVAPSLIERAIDTSILNQISFWDGLIVAAAESAHCSLLVTEDLNHGQLIDGLRVENPFR